MKASSWACIHWHPKTLLNFKQNVRNMHRNWHVSMKYQLFKVSQYLRYSINYFGIAGGYQHCIELDPAQGANGILTTVAKDSH